jgi:tetratricopeptide (TPR) repeat protein
MITGLLLVLLNPLLVRSQDSPASLATVAQGNALRAEGKFAEARDVYELVLTQDAGNAAAQQGEVAVSERLALDARSKRDRDAALIVLLRAERFSPESPQLLLDLGILEDEMRLYQDADKTLAHAEQLTPDGPNVLYAVARVKLDLGQLAVAEEKMRAYLKLRPEDASAHYGLGRIYRQGLQLDEARVEFERCIALQPTQTEGYYELGDVELQTGNFAEALANFDKTLARNGRHGGALVGSGIAYFKQKQYAQALPFLERAVAAEPTYQPGHYYLGLTLARLGNDVDSKRELAVATQLAEKDNKQSANRLRLHEQAP